MKKEYKEFDVVINGHEAKVDVLLLGNNRYECLLNKANKDFINGFDAKGFIIDKTGGDQKEINFNVIPLYINKETNLSKELMEVIWNQIQQKDLPK